MNNVIATIYKGYKVQIKDLGTYTVTGSMKLRGNYFYLLRAANGSKTNITREGLLRGQASGDIVVSL